MSDDVDDFRKRRFNPAVMGVAALVVVGGGAALFWGIKNDSERLSVEQITTLKQNLYVLPRNEQLPTWRKMADQGPMELQQEALLQLYFLHDPATVAVATKALTSSDHRVRGVAAQILAATGLPTAEPARAALLKAFKDADSIDKPQVAWALAVLAERTVARDILDSYRSGQLASVERPGGGRAFDLDVLGSLLSLDEWAALAHDPIESVRSLVAALLSKSGDKKYTTTLLQLLADKSKEVARDAAVGLGKIGDPTAVKPLLDALSRADKDDRQRFLEALRDGVGGEGLVLALGSVSKETPERIKFQNKQIFDLLQTLADPRGANALVRYLQSNPSLHWKTEAALRLAQLGDIRAAASLGERMKLDPAKIYDAKLDPEYTRDDNERVVAGRALADLAVLHPEARDQLRADAEDGVLFWCKDKPEPHANGLRFLAAINSKKVLPDLNKWALPNAPLPKAGQAGSFPAAYETAPSALRYLGWMKESWKTLDQQLFRKESKLDITEEGLMGAGISMLGMSLRGLSVGAAQGFAQWGDARAYPLLVRFLEDAKQNEGARKEACAALGWVAGEEGLQDVLKKIKAISGTDRKAIFLQGCYLETLARKPAAGGASTLLELMQKNKDSSVRRLAARALGWLGVDNATEPALFEKLKDPELRSDAALALVLGAPAEAAARAVAFFHTTNKEALADFKDAYYDAFGYWSDDDLAAGRLYRFIANAEAIAKVRVNDVLQDWAHLRLGAQFANLDFDTGPHSMTRVVLRYRLMEAARKGDTATKISALQTLQFMKEQGFLMALSDDKGETGTLARRALFALLNPKMVTGETVPEKKTGK